MEIHIKKPTDKKAKTVAMLAALPPAVYGGLWAEEGGAATHGGTDFSDINVTINDIANCTIPVVSKAKYLGSILGREPGHEADVDARVAAASSAFAKLKPLVFKNKDISIEAKRAAYVACVLTILLYGSECWALTARMRAKLAKFHNMAARMIMGFSNKQQHADIIIKLR